MCTSFVLWEGGVKYGGRLAAAAASPETEGERRRKKEKAKVKKKYMGGADF